MKPKDGPWLCVRGHDKKVVGVGAGNQCRECDRLRKLKRHREEMETHPRSRYWAIQMTGLRAAREAEGLTQRQLAKLAGFNSGFISELECGKKNATKETQMRLIAAFALLNQQRREKQARMARAGLL